MRSIFIIFSLLLSYTFANAQAIYDVNLIPKELLPHASAVVRDEEASIDVKDFDNVIYHVKKAITVLNKNGDDIAHMAIFYDKSKVIKNIKGIALNAFGKQIVKFNESDFLDQSTADGFSLFEDERVKHYIPAITEYPYTIVYEYELKYKQTLNFKNWDPLPETNLAVENSTFTFSCKPDFNIRYKETNVPGKVVTGTNSQGLKTYTWNVKNLKAIKYEPFTPYYDNDFISVKIAPEKFTYYGIPGFFTNWKELGKWDYDKLVASRQELPAETVEHVKDLTKDITDPKLKAKKIYEYMQGKTHYISVQVGIGGYEPFLASDVDHQNYGDCKALVNYTQALLKAVNIDSYYCVVESGSKYKVSMLNDFASMQQGNHIILCLPFKNDTTWADCTSQTIPFGYLGDFTDDRTVLACTPEGGKLMHTPKYRSEDNLERRKANFLLTESGELSGTMSTIFKGVDYEDRYHVVNEPHNEQLKKLQEIYPVNNLNIEHIDYKQDKGLDPVTTENIKLRARDYATESGGRIYFFLNPVNRRTNVPEKVMNRKNNVYINRGYTDEEEIIYTVPMGYHSEKKLLDYTIDKPFGKFTASMALTGNKLIFKRKLQVIDGTYSKDTYQDLVDFYQSVVDADSYTVSLIKNP
ncbi:MAG: DUF3857 domain-containing protein [Sphingobacteriales bacterium]